MKVRSSNHRSVNNDHWKLFRDICDNSFEISLPEVCDLAKNWYSFLFVSENLTCVYLQN